MSKYNLTDILNEYVGGSRIGTLNISFRDLLNKMDDLEKSGKVIVRTLSGPSGDGKVNREFEVVDRDSAVPGGNKQERGFTVYDYKFGFDPGSEEHFMEEYDFSVGGNDLKLAMELIDGVKPFGIGLNEENVIKDLAQADEVIKMIKMMNPDVREDLLKRIARMGQKKLNEGDLFSSEFDRQELKAIINDLNEQPIFDMAVRRAYKFLVSLLDKEDKEEMGLNEDISLDNVDTSMQGAEFKQKYAKLKNSAEMKLAIDKLMDLFTEKGDGVTPEQLLGMVAKELDSELESVDKEGRNKTQMNEQEMISKDKYDKLLDGAAARYEELEAQFTKFIKDEYDSDFDIENFQEFVRNNSLEEDKDIDKLKEHFKRFM